ncbi:MAG: MFS transporter [Hyphomicrobiaceae bacterium]
MTNTIRSSQRRRHPIWLIVLAAAIIAGIAMGLRQVMGLYLRPVTETLGLGREVFGLSIALANIVWGVSAPVVGALSDKFGSGRVVIVGVAATVLGLLAMYMATTDLDLLVSGALLGLGISCAGINTMVGAVGRASTDNKRTEAIAAVGMGSGVGILLALPYTHILMQQLGWQTSLLALSATACAMVLFVPFLRGQNTLNSETSVPSPQGQTTTTGEPESWQAAISEAIRYPSFWLLNAGFFVCGFHVVFYGTHLPAYVADLGLSPDVAVWGLFAVGVGNLIGTYLAGQWGKSFPKRYGLSLIYGARSVVFLGFLYLPITGSTIVLLSAVLGLLWLSTIPLTSSLVATFFGARWMTMLYGIVFFSHQAGSFLGVWLGGVVFDASQSYDVMWWISVALGIVAAIVHLPISEKPVPRPAVALQT